MKTRNLFKVLLLCTGALSFAQTVTQNFTVETIYKEGRNPMGVYTPNAGDFVTVTYYDGMGRPIQQIQKNASPVDNQNIATHIEYEKNIGQTKNYLSFTTNGNNTDFISDAKQHLIIITIIRHSVMSTLPIHTPKTNTKQHPMRGF